MAIVHKLERVELERDSKHTEVNCTYSIVSDESGNKYLQIDTYGSASRQIPGKKSQSIRFSRQALQQLKNILSSEF